MLISLITASSDASGGATQSAKGVDVGSFWLTYKFTPEWRVAADAKRGLVQLHYADSADWHQAREVAVIVIAHVTLPPEVRGVSHAELVKAALEQDAFSLHPLVFGGRLQRFSRRDKRPSHGNLGESWSMSFRDLSPDARESYQTYTGRAVFTTDFSATGRLIVVFGKEESYRDRSNPRIFREISDILDGLVLVDLK